MSYQNEQNNQQYPSSGQPDAPRQGRRFRYDPSAEQPGYQAQRPAQYGSGSVPQQRSAQYNSGSVSQQRPGSYDDRTQLYHSERNGASARQQTPQNFDVRQQQQVPQNYNARQRQQTPQNYDVRQRQQAPQNYDVRQRRQAPADYDAPARPQNYRGNPRPRQYGYDDRARRQPAADRDRRARQQYYDDPRQRRDSYNRGRSSSGSSRGRKQKQKTSTPMLVIRVIAIILLVAGLFIIGQKLFGYYNAKKAHGKLQEMVSNNSLEEYRKLRELNSDFFGWLEIQDTEDTKIDYPVMFTPNDEEKYLHTNFNGDYSESGELFIDAHCDPNGYHYLIYGHHMFNGTMFGSLPKYEDYDFYKDHHTVFFDTCDEKGTYEIFAVFKSQIFDDDYDGFEYYEHGNLNDEATYNYYVEQVKSMSLYDTGITPHYGEKIVTLSTCNYHTSDGRFVVCAKKVN